MRNKETLDQHNHWNKNSWLYECLWNTQNTILLDAGSKAVVMTIEREEILFIPELVLLNNTGRWCCNFYFYFIIFWCILYFQSGLYQKCWGIICILNCRLNYFVARDLVLGNEKKEKQTAESLLEGNTEQ